MASSTLQLLKCGVRFDPPTLVMTYKDWKSSKMRRRSMPLRSFNKNSNVQSTIQELQENKRHGRYVQLMSEAQLYRLLTIVKDKLSGLSLEASIARNNEIDTVKPDEDLNKVDPETLVRKKLRMDSSFEKNRKRPGDPDFEYNIEVDFETVEKIETSGWDSGDDSDPDF
ncbi:centrosomal protein of 19 kDa-like [Babylonia areolata]|uniref:centrosomal protein of 19 kDa-like n=1 Tax=Babylonia areolata TaxID=304850 RepID=UPI003FD56606